MEGEKYDCNCCNNNILTEFLSCYYSNGKCSHLNTRNIWHSMTEQRFSLKIVSLGN